MSAGLNFCVRATLRLRCSGCPSDTDVLKISSLPKWASSESRYEPPCAKLASCLLERHYTVLLTNSCPAAARFLRTPIKADTKSIGHILCSGEHPKRHCLSLSGQQIIERAQRRFPANSRFWITSVLLWVHAPKPDCRSRCYKSFIISGMKKQKAPNPKIRGISPDKILQEDVLADE